MDNEVSEDLKNYFEETEMQFQLVPWHVFWRNSAEREVRTIKSYVIVALCNVYSHFPFYLWYRLLPQVAMMLYMLGQYRLNPGLSAYNQVESVHNLERTSLAPLGCKVKIS